MIPPSMRPKGKGKRIYQSISSAFSRLSSPIAHSLESPPSSGPTANLPEPLTLDHPSPSLSPKRKRQRIYQSLISVFSRNTSPRPNSPDPFPPISADPPVFPNFALDDLLVPEQEDDQQSMEWRFEEPIEEEAEKNGGSSDPRQEQRNSNETGPAQP